LFARLESFIERCSDIHTLTKTITEYNMLEVIVIGGTKGRQLTESLTTIYEEFKQVVDNFKKIK
jgi:dynein heavy chain